MKNLIRTDLASEAREIAASGGGVTDGINCEESCRDGVALTKVSITDDDGARASGKARGIYYTLDIGHIWNDDTQRFRRKVYVLRDIITELMRETEFSGDAVLVAGLGNRDIVADAVGPHAVENIIITRHIKNTKPLIFENLGLFDVAAIAPGVLGQTGIESADIIRSVAERIKPAALFIIDALAARRLSRLVTTVQISTGGIAPGSGVGNVREAINSETMGFPVIVIGVPTVVDAATLTADAVEAVLKSRDEKSTFEYPEILRVLREGDLNYFVTPKETDTVMKSVSQLIGYAINLALNRELEFEEMLALL